ncbi:phage protein Gp27 family protein [Yoonia sp. R2-816]|uniref:phage protein Gp27 family protein n=1 Tax=Yoonia sp. R2-816 TaxID=3342638 RepID=UPI003728F50F
MGRGRLSSFDTMPTEAEGIIAWASQELSDRERTQTDIYAEFVEKCEALMKEHRGELEFRIPSFSSFNRYSIRMAKLTRRLDETRAVVAALSERFDPKDADDLTVMTVETIKSMVLHMLADHDDKLLPKDVMQLASAIRQAQQAQSASTYRRAKTMEFLEEAVETVAKMKGMTAETSEAIKRQILGVVN